MKHKKTKTKYRLRNWGEDNRALVQRGSLTMWITEEVVQTWHAVERESKLLLLERVLPSRVAPSSMAQALVLSDLNMMVMNGGRERTEAEYQTLCAAAGLRLTQIIPTPSLMSVIEIVRV